MNVVVVVVCCVCWICIVMSCSSIVLYWLFGNCVIWRCCELVGVIVFVLVGGICFGGYFGVVVVCGDCGLDVGCL